MEPVRTWWSSAGFSMWGPRGPIATTSSQPGAMLILAAYRRPFSILPNGTQKPMNPPTAIMMSVIGFKS